MASLAYSTPLDSRNKVAIIDTGIDLGNEELRPYLCRDIQAKDFTHFQEDPQDNHGHGTHLAGLITKQINPIKSCILSIKYYEVGGAGFDNLTNLVSSIQFAIKNNVKIVNISSGGYEPSASEKMAIKQGLQQGIIFVMAAGNGGSNLETDPYYPAAYFKHKNVHVVGSLDKKGRPLPTSNTGALVTDWALGLSVESYCLNSTKICTMSGTSQATAIITGKIAKELEK